MGRRKSSRLSRRKTLASARRKRQAYKSSKKAKKRVRSVSPVPQTYGERDDLLNSLGYSSYQDYLNSPLWWQIRNAVFAMHFVPNGREITVPSKVNGQSVFRLGSVKCRICPRQAKQVHHLSYARDVLLGKDLSKLIPVCRKCHELIELFPNGMKRSLLEARRMCRGLMAR